MKEDMQINDNLEREEDVIDIKEILLQAYLHWKLISICVIVALIGGFLVKQTITPMYQINSSVLMRQDNNDRGGAGLSSNMDMLSNMGIITTTSSFENSVELLKTRSLLTKTVTDLDLYISYYRKGLFRDHGIYKNVPIHVWVTPEDAEKMHYAKVTISNVNNNEIDVEITHINLQGDEETLTKHINKLPFVLPTNFGVFTFTPYKEYKDKEGISLDTYYATVVSPLTFALNLQSNISVEPRSKTTTIADLTLKSPLPERGEDFVEELVKNYNIDANVDKNETASRTAQFINERIQIINKELGTTENEIANFKKQAGLIDVTTNAAAALKEKNDFEKEFAETATQLRLIDFLNEYIKNEEHHTDIIPANIGLSDASANEAVAKYNEAVIQLKTLLRTSSENNPVVEGLRNNIDLMRKNVVLALQTTQKGLNITMNSLRKQANFQANQLSEAPIQQKELLSIARQQEIKANLYIMLLQKREENNILLASTANNARVVDRPYISPAPVYPKGIVIYLAALLIGIAIPALYIYLMNLLHNKIYTRADVTKLTQLPIVADIPLNTEGTIEDPIMIRENRNEMMEETFRHLRTNLQYMLTDNQQVIMFTSTMPGEGKSTTAGNLAASFAFMGKRVVVVGMDIRKPGLNKVFRISNKKEGVTEYLAHPQTANLHSLMERSDVSDNLYILPGGVIPPNPTELVNRPALGEMIAQLKKDFDIIILDTAPIGVVTDTQIIAKHADLTVYVCRSGVTNKEDFKIVNELHDTDKLKKVCIVLNGINMSDRKNYYYYGRHKRYGYGYGYGYGQESHHKNHKKK